MPADLRADQGGWSRLDRDLVGGRIVALLEEVVMRQASWREGELKFTTRESRDRIAGRAGGGTGGLTPPSGRAGDRVAGLRLQELLEVFRRPSRDRQAEPDEAPRHLVLRGIAAWGWSKQVVLPDITMIIQ